MEGISLGRGKDIEGNLRPYDWKGSIALIRDVLGEGDVVFVGVDLDPDESFMWAEGSILDEEIMIGPKCLIKW